MATLKDFQDICDADVSELLSSDEPLFVFFAEGGKSYNNTHVRGYSNLGIKIKDVSNFAYHSISFIFKSNFHFKTN